MNEPLVVETQGTAADAPPPPALPNGGAAPSMAQHAQAGYQNFSSTEQRQAQQNAAPSQSPPGPPTAAPAPVLPSKTESTGTDLTKAKREDAQYQDVLRGQPFSQAKDQSFIKGALNYAAQSITLGGYGKYVEEVGSSIEPKPVGERLQPGYHKGNPEEARAIRAQAESFSNKNTLAALAIHVGSAALTLAVPGAGEAAVLYHQGRPGGHSRGCGSNRQH